MKKLLFIFAVLITCTSLFADEDSGAKPEQAEVLSFTEEELIDTEEDEAML